MKKKLLVSAFAAALVTVPYLSSEASHWLRARQLSRLQSNASDLAGLWLSYSLGDSSFNPIAEEGAVDCRINQPRPNQVTILTGNFGGVSNRSCEVPARTPLFFPVVNEIFINTVTDVACTEDADCGFVQGTCNADALCVTGYTVDDKVFITEKFFAVDDHCDMSVTLDGQQIYPSTQGIPLLRTASKPAAVVNPATGYLDPEAVANGHWGLVPGLSRGSHTLQFKGSGRGSDGFCGGPDAFSLDVTYELDVVGRGHH